MQVCEGLRLLLYALSSSLKRRWWRRKTGRNKVLFPREMARSQVPGISQNLSILLHPVVPLKETSTGSSIWGWWGLSSSSAWTLETSWPCHRHGGAACSLQGGASWMNSEGGYFLAFKRQWWPHRALSNALPQKFMPMWTPTDWCVEKRVKPLWRKISTTTLKNTRNGSVSQSKVSESWLYHVLASHVIWDLNSFKCKMVPPQTAKIRSRQG